MIRIKQIIIAVLLLSTFLVFSFCGNTKDQDKEEENVKQILPTEASEVEVITLQPKVFTQELVSNGKLSSGKLADLRFQSSEPIEKVYLKNGDRVSKGQIIARLEQFKFNNKLKQAKDALEQSRLKLQELIIGQGYKLNDTASIPDKMLKLMKVKSGFNNAKNQYELAVFDSKQSVLRAPFNGRVANINGKAHTLPDNSKPFCNIIDLNSMEVNFSVLENELSLIKTGDEIKVAVYSMPDVEIKGRITEINPWVDENGMVKIKAKVAYNSKMLEGMNVRVSVFHALDKQWVVPKTAVVIRTGKQVVFVLKNDMAIWNYVTTGKENASEYTITSETLKDGDKIIISGNINLAHESPVKEVEN